MSDVDQRAVLARLIAERREDYSGLSRLLGKNAAYIQQFIKRGTPKQLTEKDRKTLARYFGVSEEALGGPGADVGGDGEERLVRVPKLNVGASAGPGAIPGSEIASAHIGFDPKWLKSLSGGRPADLSLIKVQGDSMSPTLVDGDDILVDARDAVERLRDGIYVLRSEDALMVKRIALSPAARRVAVKSDNDAYPDWPDCDLASIHIIGRVIWAGRRLS
jgi:SOS-response transcriptional repressor LexA